MGAFNWEGRVTIMVRIAAHPNSWRSYSARRWQLWQNSPAVITLILLVEVVAVVASIRALSNPELNFSEAGRALILLALCFVYEEAARRIEAARLRFLEAVHADMTSVWTVAAAVALHSSTAVVVVIAVRVIMWFTYG